MGREREEWGRGVGLLLPALGSGARNDDGARTQPEEVPGAVALDGGDEGLGGLIADEIVEAAAPEYPCPPAAAYSVAGPVELGRQPDHGVEGLGVHTGDDAEALDRAALEG